MPETHNFYGGEDPRYVPTYTIPVAARCLRLPVPTLRNWCCGYRYPTSADPRKQAPPVIHPPTRRGQRTFLSFANLIEAHVLATIRRTHEIPLGRVRYALKLIAEKFRTPQPLMREQFRTNGVDLFVEKFGAIIQVSGTERLEMRDVLEQRLERIEYGEGLAIRLFPLTRDPSVDADSISSQPRAIVIDPRLAFGRPVVDGSGVPIEELFHRFRAGDSVSHLAEEFRLDTSKIEEALRAAA